MVALTIEFDKNIQKLLDNMQAKSKNLTPIMQRAATIMQADVFRHFSSEEGEKGSWKPLKPATKKWKATHGWSKPLQNTGRLRMSNYPSAGKDYAQIRNEVDYAKVHQFGSELIPQRDFLWVKDEQVGKIGNMVLDYVAEAFK